MESNNQLDTSSKEFKNLVKLHRSNLFLDLEKETKSLLKSYNNDHRLINLLAMSLVGQGFFESAIKELEQGIIDCPDRALLLNSLGVTYLKLENNEKGKTYFLEALEDNREFAQAHFNLGNAYRKLGENEKAIRSYKSAIDINPNNPKAYLYLSLLYKNLGDFKESKIFCEFALDVKPDYGIAHRHLTSMLEYNSTEDDHILEMLSLMEDQNVNNDEKLQISFGLGKAFEDAQAFEEAFFYLKKGNHLHRSTLKYSPKGRKNYFSKLENTFNKELLGYEISDSNQGNKNIFIVGMPRSGTSLVEQILASHSEVDGGGELKNLHDALHSAFPKRGNKIFPDNIKDHGKELFSSVGMNYIKSVKELHKAGNYLVDKMPYNFMHIGVMALSLPASKIIICERNVIDNCFSIFKQKFGIGNEYAYSLTEIAEYYSFYKSLIDHWKELLGDKVFSINYQDLTKNQESSTRDLLAFCGLGWEEGCLQFHKTKRDVKTASAVQVRQPMYTKSVDLWKKYEIQLESLVGDLKRLNVL